MDNKKWSKRFSTIFWWLFTILPIIVALIWFIGAHLTFNSGLSSAQDYIDLQNETSLNFGHILCNLLYDSNNYGFDNLVLPFLQDMFDVLFDLLGLSGTFYIVNSFSVLFAWMVSVQLYHLIFDIIVWLPCFLHDFIDRFRK